MKEIIYAIKVHREMAKAWREYGYEHIAREHEEYARELEKHLTLAY